MEEDKPGAHININKQKRLLHVIQAVLLLAIMFGVFARYWQNQSTAGYITGRSIEIGSSQTSVVTFHTYTYTLAGGTNVGSIKFEYCSNTPIFGLPCTAPAGMNADTATLSSETGETGFSIDPAGTNANTIVIKRASASVTLAGQSSYKFDNITNPSASNQSYYVRISTHTSLDGTGSATDQGSVVFALVDDLTVSAYVPPYLAFCVGQTLGAKCSSASGFDLDMGALNPNAPATQTTQVSGATNNSTGYTVYVLGYTLTAGTNVIPNMAAAAASTVGTSQFGINARANSTPSVGQEPGPGGTLAPIGAYNTPDTFKYVSGDAIAQSPLPTDFNTLTISYVANTANTQPAGVYTTTLTYVATSTF